MGLARICVAMAMLLSIPTGAQAQAPGVTDKAPGADDAVVVAVIDQALNPYHWDFAGDQMPQARDAERGNDLPLDAAPHTWLRGFPEPETFGGYRAFPLTRGQHPDAALAELHAADADAWSLLEPSSAGNVHYYWLPGTKVVGIADFGVNKVHGTAGAHGSKVASVAVGNLHGTCPECLLVFLSFTTEAQAEAAIGWAMAQPWIDVIVNSYGFSSTGRFRDRIYDGSDVAAQRAASERGQTIFFSAGNGLNNDFAAPNTTLLSSQEGPDWIVTVGATAATGHTYSGAGKPVDVSAPGDGAYPSMGGQTVTGSSGFGGTSNATPVVGGLYASALSWARARLPGSSALQRDGLIAAGPAVDCGSASPWCELRDGTLTARELRTRLLHGAAHTPEGIEVGTTPLRTPATAAELEFASEGHGTLYGRRHSDTQWQAERQRIIGPLDGSAAGPARPDGEREWFVVDSYCRQRLWGEWRDGDWRGPDPLPAPSPLWPLRTGIATACPLYQRPPGP